MAAAPAVVDTVLLDLVQNLDVVHSALEVVETALEAVETALEAVDTVLEAEIALVHNTATADTLDYNTC